MTDLTTSQPVLELSAEFRGETITPQDPDFDRARAVYNGGIDRRPAVIVRPSKRGEPGPHMSGSSSSASSSLA